MRWSQRILSRFRLAEVCGLWGTTNICVIGSTASFAGNPVEALHPGNALGNHRERNAAVDSRAHRGTVLFRKIAEALCLNEESPAAASKMFTSCCHAAARIAIVPPRADRCNPIQSEVSCTMFYPFPVVGRRLAGTRNPRQKTTTMILSGRAVCQYSPLFIYRLTIGSLNRSPASGPRREAAQCLRMLDRQSPINQKKILATGFFLFRVCWGSRRRRRVNRHLSNGIN